MGIINSNIIDNSKISLFDKVMDVASLRHKTIAGNVANISTPGYNRKFVNFDAEMDRLIEKKGSLKIIKTDENHLSGKTDVNAPEVITDRSLKESNGINNVDIDGEMADLSENQLIYKTGATLLARKIQDIKSVIRGRS